MLTRRLVLASLFLALGCAPASAAQDPAEDLFQLYVSSVLYPESFDLAIVERSDQFTPAFMTHLDRVQTRLFTEGRQDLETCNALIDPNWRFKCQQERPAAGLWLWCVSLRMVIASDSTWQSTPQGSTFIFGKQQFDNLSSGSGIGDWVSWMRMGLQTTEPQLRAYLR